MPISKYFKGEGSKVMKSMKDRYGAKKGKQVFYATANKKGMTATSDQKKHLKQGYRNCLRILHLKCLILISCLMRPVSQITIMLKKTQDTTSRILIWQWVS